MPLGLGKLHRRHSVSSLSAETGGFNRHAIPDFDICNVGSDFDDCAGRLVTQHLWLLDKVVTDPTMRVRVQLPTRKSVNEGGRGGGHVSQH